MNSSSTDRKDVQRFGLTAAGFFGLLCLAGIWTGNHITVIVYGCLSGAGVSFVLMPQSMKPLYKILLKVADAAGRLTTLMILSITFYLVVCPMALAKRAWSGSPLPMRPDRSVDSYWVSRSETNQPKWRFKKRY